MRIVGPAFSAELNVQDGIVIEAERPVSYMRGWPLARALRLAARWHWRVEHDADERAGKVTNEPA